MKTIKSVFSLLLTIALVFTIGTVAFASSESAAPPESQMVTEDAVSETYDGYAAEPLESVIDITPPDEEDNTQPGDIADIQQPEAADEMAPQSSGSNTPYLVGAVLALALFVGVALFCKFKGNR